jgi:hypothetical protein
VPLADYIRRRTMKDSFGPDRCGQCLSLLSAESHVETEQPCILLTSQMVIRGKLEAICCRCGSLCHVDGSEHLFLRKGIWKKDIFGGNGTVSWMHLLFCAIQPS